MVTTNVMEAQTVGLNQIQESMDLVGEDHIVIKTNLQAVIVEANILVSTNLLDLMVEHHRVVTTNLQAEMVKDH